MRFQDNGWAEHCLRQQCEEKRSKLRFPYVFGWIATPAYHSVYRKLRLREGSDGLRIARRWLSDGPYRCRWYSQRELRLSLRADALNWRLPFVLVRPAPRWHGYFLVLVAASLRRVCGKQPFLSRRPTSAHARSSRSWFRVA